MFRPVSIELWLSDKNQVKSCFKPHSRCSPPISPDFNKVSSDKEVLWQEIGTQGCARHYVQMCVRSTFPKVLHIPLCSVRFPCERRWALEQEAGRTGTHKTQTTSPSLTESWCRVIWERTG